MTRRLLLLLALVTLAVPATGAAAGRTTVVPGWPVPAIAGTVHVGPAGGVVVIGDAGDPLGAQPSRPAVVAFRADGRRLWRYARTIACGNCSADSRIARRQPDGTYGPVGRLDGDAWAVDATGREVTGCTGVVLPDATCIDAEAPAGHPSIAATLAGTTLWRVVDDAFTSLGDEGGDVPPHLVRDRAGLLYTSVYGSPTGVAPFGSQLIAVDSATHTIVRRHQGLSQALVALESGVLAQTDTEGLTALDGTGAVLWSLASPAGRTSPERVALDRSRHRLYIGSEGAGASPSQTVTALDSRTGALRWRTAATARARLLSLGPDGRVYIAIDRPGHLAIRGVGPRGDTVWERRTSQPVAGARAISAHRVAVSTGVIRTPGGRLTLLRTP